MAADEEILRRLNQVPLFSGLSATTLEKLAELAHIRVEPPGTVLFRQGDPGLEFLAILDGTLRLTVRSAEEQEEHTLRLLVGGDYLGEMALIDDVPRSASAEILQECRLLAIDRDSFRALVQVQPDLAMSLLRCMARWLRTVTEDISNIAHLDVYERLARKLIQLAEQHGSRVGYGDSIRIETPLSLNVLASMISSEAEGVDRLLGMLEAQGILSHTSDRVTIHDIGRLREKLLTRIG